MSCLVPPLVDPCARPQEFLLLLFLLLLLLLRVVVVVVVVVVDVVVVDHPEGPASCK